MTAPAAEPSATLYVVATPIGNLGDLTLRAKEILASVDMIFAEDTRRTGVLLAHYGIKKPVYAVHQHTRPEQQQQYLRELLTEKKSAALVTDAGTPGVADPGALVVVQARAMGIVVVPIPGVSAVTTLASVAGLPVDRFVFYGFLPTKKHRQTMIDALCAENKTVFLYESPYRLLKLLDELAARAPQRTLVIGRELTKVFEDIRTGTVAEQQAYWKDKTPKGELVLALAPEGFGQEK